MKEVIEMLSKKALFLVTAENEIEALVAFAKKFKEKYKVEVDALYVKDIFKYEMFPVIVDGIGISMGSNIVFKEYKETENHNFERMKKGYAK